jgi:hypothetical protein
MAEHKTNAILPVIAIGGAVVSLLSGVRSIVAGDTSLEGTVSIVLLLLLSTSLGVALGIQGLTYGRAARYANAMPELLRLTERIWRQNPELLTGTQASEVCDRVVDALAKIFSQISGARCHVSIEILTRTHESPAGPQRRATDYVVVNLSRDSSSDGFDHEDRRRHSIEGNASYQAIFRDPSCSAFYFRDDVAADNSYFSTELKGEMLPSARSGGFLRDRWPLHYRSTLVVKICQAEMCRSDREHQTVGFLWLRSIEPGVFDERHDVDLLQRMSRAIAPIVTRCVQATKPSFDFRRSRMASQ